VEPLVESVAPVVDAVTEEATPIYDEVTSALPTG
jgi:hypothetical protein